MSAILKDDVQRALSSQASMYANLMERSARLENMIDALQGRVERVVITDLKDNTFFATIHVERGGQKLKIDARPSDAMALALRVKVPILVEEAVLERSSATGEEGQIDEAERLRRWLENVDPEELGRYEM